jgi:hypothetical protein
MTHSPWFRDFTGQQPADEGQFARPDFPCHLHGGVRCHTISLLSYFGCLVKNLGGNQGRPPFVVGDGKDFYLVRRRKNALRSALEVRAQKTPSTEGRAKRSQGGVNEKKPRLKLMSWLLDDDYLRALPECERQAMWLRLEQDVPEIRKCRNLTRRAIASNKVTNDYYSKLRVAGLTSTEQFEHLVGFVASIPRGHLDWRVGLYKTRKSLSAFPTRLEDMANEIQRLNRHDLISPNIWMNTRKLPGLLGESFSKLPVLLRCYADYLRSQFTSMDQSMRSPYGQVLDLLLELVRRETGRAMYTEISGILTVTANIAGSSRETDFSQDSLKIRWQRISKPT